tara:strand:+ start:916 stop:1602 length:687 start_codon:yes stop_codon:yes gene_type:complete
MEALLARTQAGIDKRNAAEQQRKHALDEARVQAVKLIVDAVGREADRGNVLCKVQFHTNHPLLQPSSVYAGYYEDYAFKNSIKEAMEDYGFHKDNASVCATKRRGGVIDIDKFNAPNAKTGITRGLRIRLDWWVAPDNPMARKNKPKNPPKAPPSESNFDLHCPVCMEDTPANVLVPCGHHVCKACVGKLHLNDSDVGIHVKNCPVCNSAFHRTQLVFADRKRKHAEI